MSEQGYSTEKGENAVLSPTKLFNSEELDLKANALELFARDIFTPKRHIYSEGTDLLPRGKFTPKGHILLPKGHIYTKVVH